MAGVTAFREAYMSADTLDKDKFSLFEARRLRYQIFWAFYENSAYRDIHGWSKLFRADYGLYRFVRNIYNPSYRLGEFWRTHLLAGALDAEAGDGSEVPSSLPILTDNQQLRPAISQLWRWSNWETKKDTLSLLGTTLGDVFLRVIDNPAKEKVYLVITHPGSIRDLTTDEWGNIKGYVLEEERADPNNPTLLKTYREIVSRDGDNVVYETYLDNRPFVSNYDNNGSGTYKWEMPYGFVPMVHIQHNDVGLDWGWSELHTALPKIREVDDLTSKLDDQIRKTISAPWLFSGVTKSETEIKTSSQAGTDTSPEIGREKVPIFYAKDANSKAQALVANVNVADVSAHINDLLKDIERDYPELTLDANNSKGDLSGRALRLHRQPVEDKVAMRRPNYLNAIARVQMMAVAIGGWRGYESFTGFDLDSYEAGKLDHSIGYTDVFKKDPMDNIETEGAFWDAAVKAKAFGIPVPLYLKRNGWSEKEIKELTESPEYAARMEASKALANINNRIGNPDQIPPEKNTQNQDKQNQDKQQNDQNDQQDN